MVFNFLWQHKPDKVKRETVFRKYERWWFKYAEHQSFYFGTKTYMDKKTSKW